MVQNNVQPSYSERIDKARAGMLAGEDNDIRTGICETVAGLPFGRAVAQGAADQGVVIGGVLAHFRGITIRDITLGAELDVYPQYANVALCQEGAIWVVPYEAVAADDPVYYKSADGTFGMQGGSGIVGPIVGARWVTSSDADGIAILELLAR